MSWALVRYFCWNAVSFGSSTILRASLSFLESLLFLGFGCFMLPSGFFSVLTLGLLPMGPGVDASLPLGPGVEVSLDSATLPDLLMDVVVKFASVLSLFATSMFSGLCSDFKPCNVVSFLDADPSVVSEPSLPSLAGLFVLPAAFPMFLFLMGTRGMDAFTSPFVSGFLSLLPVPIPCCFSFSSLSLSFSILSCFIHSSQGAMFLAISMYSLNLFTSSLDPLPRATFRINWFRNASS